MLDKNGMPKKKRKQLVACDSCRLRRVKCDKADKGDDDCSECTKKSIKCTDSYVKTKPRVVRSGKLIEKAKILYGDGEVDQAVRRSPTATASPIDADILNGSGPFEFVSSVSNQLVPTGDSRLVKAQLAHSVSDHLIQAYHDLIHTQCPIVDWAHFQVNYDASGRRAEAMSPTGECLCLVMQAWAARFSDHPSILGVGAPMLSDVQNQPGRDFSHYGQARDAFATAMLDRALRKVDENGLLRHPTEAGCAALIMLEFLVTWDDAYRTKGRHLMAAATEHLRAINEGMGEDATEEKKPEDRSSGSVLFWLSFTRDAISSMLGNRAPCLTNDDLAVLCELLANPIAADVLAYVSSDDPRILSGLAVIASFRHITNILRNYTTHLGGPLPRKLRFDFEALQGLFEEIDLSTQYSALFFDSIQNAPWDNQPKYDVWFRDLSSMRAQLCYSVHRQLNERLNFELGKGQPRTLERLADIDRLNNLLPNSSERFLNAIRDVAKLAKGYGPGRLVFEAGLSCENMPIWISHMCSMRAVEQGGFIRSWTLAAKHEEIGWLVAALKAAGWCWPNYSEVVTSAEGALDEISQQIRASALITASSQLSPAYALLPPPGPPLPIFDYRSDNTHFRTAADLPSTPSMNGWGPPPPAPSTHLPFQPPPQYSYPISSQGMSSSSRIPGSNYYG